MLWIIGIVLWLMAILFVYRSVGPNKDKTRPIPTKMRLQMGITGIVLALFGYWSFSSANTTPTAASSSPHIVYGKSSMGALVRYAVKDAIPSSNLMKNGNALLGYTAQNGNIGVNVEADDNLSHSMIVGGIQMNTAKIVHDLFRDKRVRNVVIDWYYPETDSYGNQSNIVAIQVGWTRSTYSQIDWTNFEWSNMPQVSDVYQVNSAFK